MPFGDHVQVSCPDAGLEGLFTVGAKGSVVAIRVEELGALVPSALVAVIFKV